METFRGIPISKIREHYMREGYRNEMFSSMIADVIEGNLGVVFDIERAQPEQQEQRIWELDSNEELPADPTEEEKEKKRAKNKKYLADLSIHDAAPILADDRKSSSVEDKTAAVATPFQSKLSKRQKKTLLKKAKQAQNASPAPESAGSSITSDYASATNGLNSKVANDGKNKKESKADGDGHETPEHEDEKEVATESELEAVMDTVAKRFGQ
ncbi:hypothetical protein KCU71_g4769, partial [Aureobasidium melanogenum]